MHVFLLIHVEFENLNLYNILEKFERKISFSQTVILFSINQTNRWQKGLSTQITFSKESNTNYARACNH